MRSQTDLTCTSTRHKMSNVMHKTHCLSELHKYVMLLLLIFIVVHSAFTLSKEHNETHGSFYLYNLFIARQVIGSSQKNNKLRTFWKKLRKSQTVHILIETVTICCDRHHTANTSPILMEMFHIYFCVNYSE